MAGCVVVVRSFQAFAFANFEAAAIAAGVRSSQHLFPWALYE
jgi:hypothetical protein